MEVTKLADLTREHAAAGPMNVHIPVWRFVNDHVFLTKSADVGVVFRVTGVDPERLSHVDRDDVATRFASVLRQLGAAKSLVKSASRRTPLPSRTLTNPVSRS